MPPPIEQSDLSCDALDPNKCHQSLVNQPLSISNTQHFLKKSAFQLYSKRHSTRFVGNMLSNLSKSDKKRGDELRKETERRKSEKLLRRKKLSYQNRINHINSMRRTYMTKDKDVNNNCHEKQKVDRNCMPGAGYHYANKIPAYKMIRNSKQVEKVKEVRSQSLDCMKIPDVNDTTKDSSMRELIDWLENVDLNRIDDFI